MAVSAVALADALTGIVGPSHLVTDPSALAAAALGGIVPRWIARPSGVEEVSRLLVLASDERLAGIPRGAGTSMGLGAAPRRVDLVLDCRRLDRVVEYVADDMVATVGAGISLGALGTILEKNRQRFPLDPAGGPTRTVGGVLATNGSGPLRFRYGAGRDLLLGARFVQADGTVTWGGARVVKSVTGYDVPKLLVGSLGTLGVIVEASLRLHPVPPAARSWLFSLTSVEGASAFAAAILESAIEPSRLVILDAGAVRAAGRDASAGGGVAVAVSVESVEEAVASHGRALAGIAQSHGSEAVALSGDFWATLAQALTGPVTLKLVGEPNRLGSWLTDVEGRCSQRGVTVKAVGETGSGILWAALDGSLDAAWLGRDLVDPLREGLAAEGGSVIVEHAAPGLRGTLDPWGLVDEAALAIMRRIKTEFDPLGIVNPGRFVGGL